ncbi:MAG: hypothetical protein R3F62_12285 [Planctomycetota bacterium]
MAEPEPLPLPMSLPRTASVEDNERTRLFQVVLRKAIKRRSEGETDTERQRREETELAEDDALVRELEAAFAPHQSDPLMMQIAEQAERFLRQRRARDRGVSA